MLSSNSFQFSTFKISTIRDNYSELQGSTHLNFALDRVAFPPFILGAEHVWIAFSELLIVQEPLGLGWFGISHHDLEDDAARFRILGDFRLPVNRRRRHTALSRSTREITAIWNEWDLITFRSIHIENLCSFQRVKPLVCCSFVLLVQGDSTTAPLFVVKYPQSILDYS